MTSRRSFDQRAAQATAVVERVCGCTGAVVHFTTAAGEPVETKVALNGTDGLEAGSPLLVAYDPAHPTGRVEAPGRRGAPWRGAATTAAVFAFTLLPLLVMGRRTRDRAGTAADLAGMPGAAGQGMRIVTWSTLNRGAATAASLYPDTAEPPPADTLPVGVVTLLPMGAAGRIAPWSPVDVVGSLEPGGTVAVRHDGRTYLASGPVRAGAWETRRRPRPSGTAVESPSSALLDTTGGPVS